MSTDFLTIDESTIPEGGDSSKFGPLEEGSYSATCVAMVKGLGTKYQKVDTEPKIPEQKVRFVFAINEPNEEGAMQTHFVRTNWMKISLCDGGPNPSALWNILRAWTKQKSAEELFAKMGKFDLKFFIGKPINLVLKVTKDEKYNTISDYTAPKKGQSTVEPVEIPAFSVSADKWVTDDIGYILMDGCTIKPKKEDTIIKGSKDDGETAAPPAGTAGSGDGSEDDLPF